MSEQFDSLLKEIEDLLQKAEEKLISLKELKAKMDLEVLK